MKKMAALALGSLLVLNSTAFAFSDLATTHWAYRNVMNMQDRGIISGFTDDTFRPDIALTREQFITMAVKGLGLENAVGTVIFEDSSDRWSESYIKVAGDTMTDEGDMVFRPADLALREDIAMSIVRLNGLENADYSLDTLSKFSDVAEISAGRKKYVAIAVENGFMSGNANGTFSPQKALTRAEGATVIFNMLDKIGNISKLPTDEISGAWNGEYISNVDGLVKVKLEKLSDTEVRFSIKGKKTSLFGGCNVATINGDTAVYEYGILDDKGEIKFRFSGSDLVIETSGYEDLAVYSGRYQPDDGTVSTLKTVSEKNPLEGSYSLGSLNLTLTGIAPESANFEMSGIADGKIIFKSGTLQKLGDKWKYFDIFATVYTLEMELHEDRVIVTGLDEENSALSGIYEKEEENAEDEFKKYEEAVDALYLNEGVFLF
ncbi:MAG: S-layer homology domain-containing protein [Clostridia bacterium]|nr:S-layer homology domain-containing protein [Clostridia bacterium]